MSLHVDRYPCRSDSGGVPMLLIHGWGMHGGMWQAVAERLSEHRDVYVADLPGHGSSGLASAFTLDSLVRQLSERFEQSLVVMGWSLGGIIAQHWAAREPDKITRMVLVASTPSFAEREDWEWGMPQETLAQFAAELEKNFAVTLRRFLALQVRGSEDERELLGVLREQLFSRGEPHLDALRGGLEILRDADLRSVLPTINLPVLCIAGQRDKLTHPAASHFLAQAMPNARTVEIAGAAHAPFLSHQDIFIEHVKNFLYE